MESYRCIKDIRYCNFVKNEENYDYELILNSTITSVWHNIIN